MFKRNFTAIAMGATSVYALAPSVSGDVAREAAEGPRGADDERPGDRQRRGGRGWLLALRFPGSAKCQHTLSALQSRISPSDSGLPRLCNFAAWPQTNLDAEKRKFECEIASSILRRAWLQPIPRGDSLYSGTPPLHAYPWRLLRALLSGGFSGNPIAWLILSLDVAVYWVCEFRPR